MCGCGGGGAKPKTATTTKPGVKRVVKRVIKPKKRVIKKK